MSLHTFEFLFFRGLFEKDKLVFSFMLCIEIMRNAGDISLEEWNFFLRGSAGLDKQRPVKPSVPWISRIVWNQACDLSDAVPAFRGIYQDLTKTPCWIKLGENLVCQQMSCVMRKPTLWFPIRSDTNWAVQAQKMVRGWKGLGNLRPDFGLMCW